MINSGNDKVIDAILDKISKNIELRQIEKDILANPNDLKLREKLSIVDTEDIIDDFEDTFKSAANELKRFNDYQENRKNSKRPIDSEAYSILVVMPLVNINGACMHCSPVSKTFESGRAYTMKLESTSTDRMRLTECDTGYFVGYNNIHKLFTYWNIIEIIETNA
jgi:hypothetical protein